MATTNERIEISAARVAVNSQARRKHRRGLSHSDTELPVFKNRRMEFTALQQNVVEVSTWHSAIVVLAGVELTLSVAEVLRISFASFFFYHFAF